MSAHLCPALRRGAAGDWPGGWTGDEVGGMESFRGRYTNRIDAKGRVSVPAKFRAITIGQGYNGIVCFPSLKGASVIEGCGPEFSNLIDEMLAQLAPFSDEREELAMVLHGNAWELMFDADGRVVLPEELRERAGITGDVTFVGMGQRFQIWEPKAYEAHYEQVMKKVGSLSDLLKPPAQMARERSGNDGGAS
ncbi:division/cell wall cluster transcriptional repressor MraZ [Parvibaculum indicum]|uniref:division/cell wall cluster transcriptional repressor MraZ n=1 Tax=Parvibaculum indicum TaxID=562969 RepID=UPI00141E4596|nr:division/cell wall cluster transcriptional repressor MraZ [Parvibaculum indicum]